MRNKKGSSSLVLNDDKYDKGLNKGYYKNTIMVSIYDEMNQQEEKQWTQNPRIRVMRNTLRKTIVMTVNNQP